MVNKEWRDKIMIRKVLIDSENMLLQFPPFVEHDFKGSSTEIGKKAWLFAKLQPGRASKRINAT